MRLTRPYGRSLRPKYRMKNQTTRAVSVKKRQVAWQYLKGGGRRRQVKTVLALLLATGGVLMWAYWCEQTMHFSADWLVASNSSAAAANSSACTFEYPGPLRPESLNCFLEFFPHSAPIAYPGSSELLRRHSSEGSRRFFTLSGVRWEQGPPPVPIFIIFKDRVSVLLEMLRSLYRYLRTPYEIVIIHDNSTFPGAIHFIDRLKDSGVSVHEHVHPWADFNQFYSQMADFIGHYMQESQSDHYVLSDPDCALDSAPWNMLFVYRDILEGLGLDVAGAALRWDDFPEELSWTTYEAEIARLPAKTYAYRGRNYYYIEAPVDTTFAMYRKGPRLARLAGKHIRMLPPLGVRHLDFYFDKTHLPDDYKHYHSAARKKAVNHMDHLD